MASPRCAAPRLVAALLLLLLALAGRAAAYDATEDTFAVREGMLLRKCYPMYTRGNIPGAMQDATIAISPNGDPPAQPAPFAIYNQADYIVGIPVESSTAESPTLRVVCTQQLHDQGKCGVSQVGQIILAPTNNGSTPAYHLLGVLNEPITDTYTVPVKGLHCIAIYAIKTNTTGTVYFQFPYGKLPPMMYPNLPFYGFIGLTYAIIGMVWLAMCMYYWTNILKMQIYISGIIFLNMLEMTFAYAYYANWNDNGDDSDALVALTCLLQALRGSVSLMALLVVCMGYGLVKPTLGQDWNKVVFLGFTNFIFAALYNAEAITSAEPDSIQMLMYVIPLVITLVIFMLWTLTELTSAMAKLALRRQTVKLRTYTNLRRVLFVTLVVVVILAIPIIVQNLDKESGDLYWDLKWFTSSGSFSIVYLCVFLAIILLWRPHANNARAGVEQLPADDLGDDDFEELELGRMGVVGSVASDRVKSRRGKSRDGGENEEDDPLKWVEENMPELLEDDGDITLSKEDQVQLIRSEMSKMN